MYVNGQLAGEWDYCYMSFRVDATPYVKFGEMNVIAVQADTRPHGTRWYPGAGIYRKVTMTICEPVHLARWGTYVTTPQVTDASAMVRVRSTVDNHTDIESKVTIEVILLDPKGKSVASGRRETGVPAGGATEVDQTFTIKNPQRWTSKHPHLTPSKTIVRTENAVTIEDTSFGVRSSNAHR